MKSILCLLLEYFFRFLANGWLKGILRLELLLVALQIGLPVQALVDVLILLLGHDYLLAALINLRDEVEMLVLFLLPTLHFMLDPLHLLLLVDCLVVQPREDIAG